MEIIEVPVLFAGGGGAGLTASMMLAAMGVETLLVNLLPTTSILPRAHVLGQRAMEIMTDCGVAGAILTRPDRCIPCLLYTSPSPRDRQKSRMPSSA